MANGIFFLSWELWQQMTFVLAMAIVAVFCAGLVKLWWNNRLVRKQEILDEEKRARYTDMRRTGLSVKRGNDIPFGVRAIQSGIEVDGIWISRPATPNETPTNKHVSSSTLASIGVGSQRRGENVSEDPKAIQTTTVNLEKAAPRHSPSDGSIFQRLNGADSWESTPSGTTPPVSQFAPQHKKHAPRGPSVLNEDTLRRLEGQAHPRPTYDTYIPTSAPRNPRRPSQRSEASSSGESMESQPRSARSASGRSYTSSRSSRLYMARNIHQQHDNRHGGGHSAVTPVWEQQQQHHHRDRDPFDTPTRTPSGLTALSQSETRNSSILQNSQEMPPHAPEPTFGPDDLHVNRSSRRVNNGFEVLPAGTFGIPPHEYAGAAGQDHLESVQESNRVSKSPNRLRKKASASGQLQ
ncbi:hypothetical protein B0H66DRAFT_58624 [Apodospora peruviana]|uniref:Uncharacterized protein n=1 Tax=Apodospora peruviana TaxID=516989 RepID=A0AAE0ISA3_9PEZI|nr:hypothetical protein B0H66DRAFT_58624 [Apodospora peruviana]